MNTSVAARPAFVARFNAFVTDQAPFAMEVARSALDAAVRQLPRQTFSSPRQLDTVRRLLAKELRLRLRPLPEDERLEVAPGVRMAERQGQAIEDLVEMCDGFLHRESLLASLSTAERREILGGMILTRAVDNRLKLLHAKGEVFWDEVQFPGTGYRSLGREAVYAAGLRLRRGSEWRGKDGGWNGDLVAPSRRGLGLALAMHPEPDLVYRALSAQAGKGGAPPAGRTSFFGDLARGVLPAANSAAISSLTATGFALALAREDAGRVAVVLVGDGGSALGEWHEAINQAALRRLPVVFLMESEPALASTEAAESAARQLADKAAGYGLLALRVDGADPDAVAVAAAWAVERARQGSGPTLLDLVAMRMCGVTHATDDFYLGQGAEPGWDYAELGSAGCADAESYRYWSERDPIQRYAARLAVEQLVTAEEVVTWKAEAEEVVEAETQRVLDAPWPKARTAGEGVFSDQPPAHRSDPLLRRVARQEVRQGLPDLETGAPYHPAGAGFGEAIQRGLEQALEADSRVFLFGPACEARDQRSAVLEPIRQLHGQRVPCSPSSPAGVLGICIGAALAGQRPIGEIRAAEIASAFNPLVTSAAQLRFRYGQPVPMVLRVPGGEAHSPDPASLTWFYSAPGLKIAVPSTPQDAQAMLLAAVEDPDPVLFYEPMELYESVELRQPLPDGLPEPLPLGRAALRRAGSDLLIVSWGALVHRALRVAEKLAEAGTGVAVLDLRSLVPLDRQCLLRCVRHCGRVLIVHRDSRMGGVGESLAAIIQEEAFEYLDAPVRILGALDTPMPYSPPLVEAFVPGQAEIERAARLLLAY